MTKSYAHPTASLLAPACHAWLRGHYQSSSTAIRPSESVRQAQAGRGAAGKDVAAVRSPSRNADGRLAPARVSRRWENYCLVEGATRRDCWRLSKMRRKRLDRAEYWRPRATPGSFAGCWATDRGIFTVVDVDSWTVRHESQFLRAHANCSTFEFPFLTSQSGPLTRQSSCANASCKDALSHHLNGASDAKPFTHSSIL